ncbi:hypothetical protein LCGC14_2129230 [marine sediment metagenome]|uniref:Uncharacterized protein n=1 Tax=marine sediment metagenome TaxID=412755 RepID=A0A0F9E1X9_9ZZZZ
MAETLIFSTGSLVTSGSLSVTGSIQQLDLDGVSGSFTGSFTGSVTLGGPLDMGTNNIINVGEITLTGLLLTAASVAGGAKMRLPHGTAPSSPVDGDFWTTTASAFICINGVTEDLLGGGGGGLDDLTDVTLTTPAPGEFLQKSAGNWLNVDIVAADVLAGSFNAGDYIFLGNADPATDDAHVLLGTTVRSKWEPRLDIVSGRPGTNVPTLVLADRDTDAATKAAGLACRHYTNAEQVAAMIACASGVTTTVVRIGGGHGTLNAATEIHFYTAANNITTIGTEMMRFDFSTTTDDTRMLVYDVTGAALVRVSRGAADSGGSGFRVLRIPN